MPDKLLNSQDASQQLGVSTLTLYDWLAQSDAGHFVIRGEETTIHYFQGGRKGQGRIKIAESEVKRLLMLMAVNPRQRMTRKPPRPEALRRHITTKPGRPDD